MKDFFKNVLATIVGIAISTFLIFGLIFLLFVGIIASVMKDSTEKIDIKKNSVLVLNLSGIMKDRVEHNPFIDYIDYNSIKEMALTEILSAIEKAQQDNRIKGIYIDSGLFFASPASLKELRNKLNEFKSSGKFVIAYADTYTQNGYYLSSVADQVILNPQGTLDLHGLAVSRTFYKDLLDKLGVEMQIFKVGTYKSAVEPYMIDKMSDANKEQSLFFAKDIWFSMLLDISNSRKLSVDKLNELSDSLIALKPIEYIRKEALVDSLLYQTEVKTYLKELAGTPASEKLTLVSVQEVNNSLGLTKPTGVKDEIAILYAEGTIMSGNNNLEINDRYIIRQIEKLKEDKNVKSVVFRVNSPGGSAYASEQIWKAITDLKAKKPVVVSMGDYAASGGYYISCNASKIFAQPQTLTGSIGIFGVFPNMEGLTQKVGLTFDGVKTNQFADFGEVTRPMRPEEKEMLQGYVERGYDLFLTRCSAGRNIAKESLDKIAQGRVWTGKQALELGLVDALGGINDAVKAAAQLANIETYQRKEYPKPLTPFEVLLNVSKESFTANMLENYFGSDMKFIQTAKEIATLQKHDYIQARIPYEFILK